METKLIEHKKNKSNNWVKLDIRNRNSESKISTKNNFGFKKKPEWIRVKLPTGKKYSNLIQSAPQEVVPIWVNAGVKALLPS